MGALQIGLTALAGAVLLGAAALKAAEDLSESAGKPERLLVLQPAIPTRLKFQPAQQRRLLEQLAQTLDELSGSSVTEAQPANRSDLVDGPVIRAKTSVPTTDWRFPPSPEWSRTLPIAAVLLPEGALPLDQPLPQPAPVEVLSGGFRRQGEGLRSALLRFEPGERWPTGGVDKHRLVPLGEWVPLARFVRWSGLSAVGGLEPGTDSRLLRRPGGPIGVAICYELADGHALAKASREGAQWLLASANLDPYPALLQRQFAAVAQLRSIETGRWLVSSANTGPSLVVDPAGRLRTRLKPQTTSRGVVQLRRLERLSLYSRWPEAPLWGLVGLAVACRASCGNKSKSWATRSQESQR